MSKAALGLSFDFLRFGGFWGADLKANCASEGAWGLQELLNVASST